MELDTRTLEPELMNDAEQAEAYAAADFSEPHNLFVSALGERFPEFHSGNVLDLGCGTADISLRLLQCYPEAYVIGVDGSAVMLSHGERILRENEIESDRFQLVEGFIPGVDLPYRTFDLIVSNSLLHHLPNPEVLWKTIVAYSRSGTLVFVGDLIRPRTDSIAREMVKKYSGGTKPIHQEDFYNSLLAAFRIEEVSEQLRESGLAYLEVEQVSDRHQIIWGTIR